MISHNFTGYYYTIKKIKYLQFYIYYRYILLFDDTITVGVVRLYYDAFC